MRKWIALLATFLFCAIPATAQVPKTVMAEVGAATGCGNCPDAYAGLDLMHQWYDSNEFVSVRYYGDSQSGFYTPEMGDRVTTYNLGPVGTRVPTVWFGGTVFREGGGAATASGLPYKALFEQSIGSSPFKMGFQIFNPSSAPGTGVARVRIDCITPPGDISRMTVKIVVYEDFVPYTDPAEGFLVHYEVARDILDPVPLTTANPGDCQVVDKVFPVNATWVPANIHALAFVQEEGPDTTKPDDPIRQACSSVSLTNPPEYSMTYYSVGDRIVLAPTGTPYSFGDFAFSNAGGEPDTFTVRIVPERAPAGWTAEFTDGASVYTGEVQVPLSPGDTKTYHVRVTPTTADYGRYRIEIFSGHAPARVVTLEYMVIAEGVCALVVDHDGGEPYEDYYTAALDTTAFSYAVWPYAEAAVPASILQRFRIVIWYSGHAHPALSADDRAALASYLDGGGNLFISGQDIGWELVDPHGGAMDPAFEEDYLHAAYLLDDPGAPYNMTGVSGDPIGNGLSFCLSCGDSAGYAVYPDVIRPFDSFASNIFLYGTGASGGLKAATGAYRVVYLAFGFESIGDPAGRATLMSRIIDWLGACRDAPDCPAGTPDTVTLMMAGPDATDLRLNWPSDPKAVGGFNVYSTDDRTIVARLRKENSYTPVATFPAGSTSGTLPMAGGLTYYQVVGACNNNVEGPN